MYPSTHIFLLSVCGSTAIENIDEPKKINKASFVLLLYSNGIFEKDGNSIERYLNAHLHLGLFKRLDKLS